MKHFIRDNLENIVLFLAVILIFIYFVSLLTARENFIDEKECWDYYLKNNVKLKNCKEWFK